MKRQIVETVAHITLAMLMAFTFIIVGSIEADAIDVLYGWVWLPTFVGASYVIQELLKEGK